jgi:hypothetical protein
LEGFKVEYRPGHALDGSMVLLNEIIQILDLTNLGGYLPIRINPIDSRFVRLTLVHRDLLGITIMAHGLFEDLSGRCLIALGRLKTARVAKFYSKKINATEPDGLAVPCSFP